MRMQYRFAPQAVQAGLYTASEKRWAAHGENRISFVDGISSADLLPIEVIREAEARALRRSGSLLQHTDGEAGGSAPFRDAAAALMAARGMQVQAEHVLAVAGSQQAIDLAVRALAVPGDAVLVETPANPAALRTFALNGLHVLQAEGDESGIDLEQTERLVNQRRPRMIYAMPTFGVPAGQAWNLERRRGLLRLARQHGIPIIEDDSYGEFGYDESVQHKTLYSLAGGEGGVLYVSACMAAVLPKMRIGWAAGDGELIAMMAGVSHSIGAGTGFFEQRFMGELLGSVEMNAHRRKLASCYGRRMNRLIRLLEESGTADLAWAVPQGGSSLWLRLPDGLDGEALLRGAQRKDVFFEPGAAFYANHPQRNTARLSVASVADDQLEPGVKRFLEAIEEFTARG